MGTNLWAGTIPITVELASELINSQFPDLHLNDIYLLGEGWDNKAYLVNGCYVFRFPRRQEGVDLMSHEIRVLPLLAQHVHLPMTHPRFIGYPTSDFPYPFAGYDYLEGEAIADVDLAILPQTSVLSQLAHFLRDLHAIPLEDIPTQIDHDVGRMDYEPRVPVIKEGLEVISRAGHSVDDSRVMSLVESCASAFPGENTCIIHGDLHPRHILIQDGKISGIIDWGDVSYGSIAMDLSILYSLYPSQYHDDFWAIYGVVSKAVKYQALFRAIYSNILLATYALDTHYPALLNASLQGLENCLTWHG